MRHDPSQSHAQPPSTSLAPVAATSPTAEGAAVVADAIPATSENATTTASSATAAAPSAELSATKESSGPLATDAVKKDNPAELGDVKEEE